jgi:L-alanine-DL-glutamate epimerase-like enolase superfamily enzyme
MKVARIEPVIVNIPSLGQDERPAGRNGVTAVLVRVETDTGLVGWGEGSVGANAESVYEAVRAAIPIVLGRSPWSRQAIADDFFTLGQWSSAWRPAGANYAYSGVDMALWDLCGQDCGQPLYNLLGGRRRPFVDYYFFVRHCSTDEVAAQCRDALARGFSVFYTKVGLDDDVERELRIVETIRQTIGPKRKIRIDANCRWTLNEGLRNLLAFDRFGIDFAEAPVPFEPLRNMVEIRARTPVAIAANEGLGTVGSVWECIRARACDVLCFSPFFVGTIADYHRLAHAAHLEGIRVCKHTHNETGIAAAAAHHVLLTLPNVVDGNQSSYDTLSDDVLTERLPIRTAARWGAPTGPGLGIRVDEDKVRRYRDLFEKYGQYLPYRPEELASEERSA